MSKVVSVEEAIASIADGSTVTVCGCENILLPEYLLANLEKRFLETGHPRDLTEIHTVIHGMGVGLGLEHFAHEGMTKKVIGSGYSYLKTSKMTSMIRENKIPAYLIPMGTVLQIMANVAAGEPYTYSKVGFGTFVDCDVEGGCVNSIAENTFCTRDTIHGEEMLCYKNPKIDVAILRGTTADEFGNISLEHEPMTLGVRTLAMAARASGGKVIVQVSRLVKRGSIDPQKVVIPGIMVDMVVVDENQAPSGGRMNPALTGEIRIPVSALEPLPLDAAKVISRRAAQEITKQSAVVNLGVGIPINIPMIQVEENSDKDTIFFPEHGALVMMALYVTGMVVAILVGLLLKGTIFKGNPIPFVMELPAYRLPSAQNVLRHMWEKAKDFVVKAFTIIFVATIIVWVLQNFSTHLSIVTDSSDSILAAIGQVIAPVFAPLGFGDWRATTALITGLMAKETVVSTLAVLMNVGEPAMLVPVLSQLFTPLAAVSFLVFTLLYMPCVAAMAAVRRELGSLRGAAAAMAFQTSVAWVAAFLVYQVGMLLGF